MKLSLNVTLVQKLCQCRVGWTLHWQLLLLKGLQLIGVFYYVCRYPNMGSFVYDTDEGGQDLAWPPVPM